MEQLTMQKEVKAIHFNVPHQKDRLEQTSKYFRISKLSSSESNRIHILRSESCINLTVPVGSPVTVITQYNIVNSCCTVCGWLGKVKAKGHQIQATKGLEGSRGIALLFFYLGARRGGWSAPRPCRFTPGKDPVPIV
jgi:hypothetical protein